MRQRVPTVLARNQANYTYVAAHPTSWAQLWPNGFPLEGVSEAVLLEFAPSSTIPRNWEGVPTTEQQWPRDTLRHLSSLGVEAKTAPTGLPIVGPEILRDYSGIILDYCTIALVPSGHRVAGVQEWTELRRVLLKGLTPATLDLPAGCRGVLHVAGHELAVFLTHDERVALQWMLIQVRSWFPHLNQFVLPPDDDHDVGQWIAQQARSGLRIESLEAEHANGILKWRLRGRAGIGDEVLLTIGSRDGPDVDKRFEMTFDRGPSAL